MQHPAGGGDGIQYLSGGVEGTVMIWKLSIPFNPWFLMRMITFKTFEIEKSYMGSWGGI